MPSGATNSSGPLSGYRIIDVTQMLSGPMATMMLGDQGADVVKVEPPGIGDLTRAMGASKHGIPPAFAVINRNKRSIALDLKDHRGLAVLKHLVAGADVFVQNFRPGRAERMGIGERELRRIKPDLIYVSISGFGEKGPYVEKRVYDPVIQALSGLAAIQTDYKTGRPQMMRLIIPDKVSALTAAQAITAALLARERTGEGQHVRLAMLDAVISFLWPEGMADLTFTASTTQSARRKSRDLIFETADGYITCGANSNAEWKGLAKALGHPEWIDDPRFNTVAARIRNVSERLESDRANPRDEDLRRMAREARGQRCAVRARAKPRGSHSRCAGRCERIDRGIEPSARGSDAPAAARRALRQDTGRTPSSGADARRA